MPDRDVALSMWVVYERPIDMPAVFVARRFELDGSPAPRPTTDVLTGLTLEAVRAQLPIGMDRIPRSASDEAQIVECWI